MQEYNKLVRDRIPEIIQRNGDTCEVVMMNEEEYQQALRTKLIEEALEASTTTTPQELVSELADVYEVLEALQESCGISSEQVKSMQTQRRQERGGFTQRIRLLYTQPNDNESNIHPE